MSNKSTQESETKQNEADDTKQNQDEKTLRLKLYDEENNEILNIKISRKHWKQIVRLMLAQQNSQQNNQQNNQQNKQQSNSNLK